MNRRLIALTTALGVALSACVAPSTGTPAPEDLADFDVDPSVTVELDESGFSPPTVEVDANVTVAIVNVGDGARQARQLDTSADRRINTGDLLPGETVAVHLADPGTIELGDTETGETLTLEVGPAAPVARTATP